VQDGLVVFVGGLKWFGVRWGLHRVPRGLADAGFRGPVLYWEWHQPLFGLFCLPVYRNRRKLEAQAARLAEFITTENRESPRKPLHVMGCSAGGYVALRAVELLDPGVRIRSLVLLSVAVDPAHDLSVAAAHVDGPLLNASSRMDWFVLGLGTLLLGTAEGTHAAAAGMTGFRPQETDVSELRWRPAMIGTGWLGGHSTCTPRAFIARYIAPAMGIGAT